MGRERKKKKNQCGRKNSSRTKDDVHSKIEKGACETSNSPKPKHVVKLSFSKQKIIQHPYIVEEENVSRVVYTKEEEKDDGASHGRDICKLYPRREIQVKGIENILKSSMARKCTEYRAISLKWWQSWCQRVGFDDQTNLGFNERTKENLLAPIPKEIDNESIANRGTVRPEMVEGKDFKVLPVQAFSALQSWYGGGPELVVISSSRNNASPAAQSIDKVEKLEVNSEIVFDPTKTTQGSADTPSLPRKVDDAVSVGAPSAQVTQQLKNVINEEELTRACDLCLNMQDKLKSCSQCKNVWYCSKLCQRLHWKTHKRECKNDVPDKRRLGRCGLRNLGNTCFMNSIIQCLSHTMPLTSFFLSQKYLNDLNETNPIGFQGKLAENWCRILNDLWHGTSGSINPMKFKRMSAKLAKGMFGGFQQHDSQEFLSFLIDGLHEDLNRILKKPYIEDVDNDGTKPDREAAAEMWDKILQRDNSVVLDHTYGQHKSTVECPKCKRVSITYNKFNQLTLPVNKKVYGSVLLVRLYKNRKDLGVGDAPEIHTIEVTKTTSVADVKRYISKRSKIQSKALLAVTVRDGEAMLVKDFSSTFTSVKREGDLVLYEIIPSSSQAGQRNIAYTFVLHGTDVENDIGGDIYGVPLLLSYAVTDSTISVRQMLMAQKCYMLGNSRDSKNSKDVGAVYACSRRGKVKESEMDQISDAFGHLSCKAGNTMESEWGAKKKKISYMKAIWKEKLKISVTRVRNADKASGDGDGSMYAHGGTTLFSCLNDFTKTEVLDKDNLWYCSACKEHVAGRKKMEIWQLPDVLILHLKRFVYKNPLYSKKIDTVVSYPLSSLNMKAYCCDKSLRDDDYYTYDLFAVSNHFGRMGFGHYTAYARNSSKAKFDTANEQWRDFDDASVSEVSADQVKSNPAAYVLFYQRRKLSVK